jgi:hypothetical protein
MERNESDCAKETGKIFDHQQNSFRVASAEKLIISFLETTKPPVPDFTQSG